MKLRSVFLSIGLLAAATPASACFVGVQHGPAYETAPADEATPWPAGALTSTIGLNALGVMPGDDVRLQCSLVTVNAETADEEEAESGESAGQGNDLLGLQPFSNGVRTGPTRAPRGTSPSMMSFLAPVGGGGLGGFFGGGGGGGGGEGDGSSELTFDPGTDDGGGGGDGGGQPGFGPGGDPDGFVPGGPDSPEDNPGTGDLPGAPTIDDIVTVVPEPGTAYLFSVFLLAAAGLSRLRRGRS